MNFKKINEYNNCFLMLFAYVSVILLTWLKKYLVNLYRTKFDFSYFIFSELAVVLMFIIAGVILGKILTDKKTLHKPAFVLEIVISYLPVLISIAWCLGWYYCGFNWGEFSILWFFDFSVLFAAAKTVKLVRKK